MTLLTLEHFYAVIGLIFALLAGRLAWAGDRPRRLGAALFWALLGTVFLFGKVLPPAVVGYLVLGMVLLAAARQVRPPESRAVAREARLAEAAHLGNRLFWPALVVPATAVLGSLALGRIQGDGWRLVEARQVTLIALGLGALLGLGLAMRTTRARWSEPAEEGGRLLASIGWALVLPQLLAALGGIFAQAGVGSVVADLVAGALPTRIPLVAVAAYCLGMAAFTVCMGNAFAAFAVITGGIGLPLIVQQHHGNPAIMAAIGMLSGYCGTLLTPMAANFNLVPAMLLELPDRHAVIKAQVPFALVILAANIVIMDCCVYRF